MITASKVSIGHLLAFGSLHYIAKDKRDINLLSKSQSLSHELKLQCLWDMVSMKDVGVSRDSRCISRIRVAAEELCIVHILIHILHIFHIEMLVKNEWHLCREQAICQEKGLSIGKFLFHQKSNNGKHYRNAIWSSGIRGTAYRTCLRREFL